MRYSMNRQERNKDEGYLEQSRVGKIEKIMKERDLGSFSLKVCKTWNLHFCIIFDSSESSPKESFCTKIFEYTC